MPAPSTSAPKPSILDRVGSLLDAGTSTLKTGVKTEVTVNVTNDVYLKLVGAALVAAFCILLMTRVFRAV